MPHISADADNYAGIAASGGYVVRGLSPLIRILIILKLQLKTEGSVIAGGIQDWCVVAVSVASVRILEAISRHSWQYKGVSVLSVCGGHSALP